MKELSLEQMEKIEGGVFWWVAGWAVGVFIIGKINDWW